MDKVKIIAHPRRTSLLVGLALFTVIALLAIGFALLYNAVQETRRDRFLQNMDKRGQVVNETELNNRFPVIEFF